MLPLYWQTGKHLRARQILARAIAFLPSSDLRSDKLPERSGSPGLLVHGVTRPPVMTGPSEFHLLNRTARVRTASDWNSDEHQKLLLYNLHYFDDLTRSGAALRAEWHADLIRRWIEENPPTVGNGWEPYPTSIRIVNWVKWAWSGGGLSHTAEKSLALQARWLRKNLEYHLLGNHLLANAKALIFAGAFFEGEEADEWIEKGIQTLLSELDEQVLEDGGHFERSPMYHSLLLEDLLDLVNLLGRSDLPDKILKTVARMSAWLNTMSHPDGEITFFNDSAFKIAACWSELREYAERLEIPFPEDRGLPLDDRRMTGFTVLRVGHGTTFVDSGVPGPDYLPGHAHAGTLSFELSAGIQRVIVNSGVSQYGEGPERLRQRGSRAHNTLVIDDTDSSEVWAGFRMARRCRILQRDCGSRDQRTWITATHDGYRRLPGKPFHRRSLMADRTGLTIEDEVQGKKEHGFELVFLLHPTVQATPLQQGWLLTAGDRHLATMTVSGPGQLARETATWHPEFGKVLPTVRLVVSHRGPAPVHWTTRIDW